MRRRSFLNAMAATAVRWGIEPGIAPVIPNADVTGALSALPTAAFNKVFVDAVAERFVAGILNTENPIRDTFVIPFEGDHVFGKDWEVVYGNNEWGGDNTATYDLSDDRGFFDFRKLLKLPSALAGLPATFLKNDEEGEGVRASIIATFETYFQSALLELHDLLKLKKEVLECVQKEPAFKEFLADYDGVDAVAALTHDDIKRFIGKNLEEMRLFFHEADRVLPEKNGYKGLTTFDALLHTTLEDYLGTEETSALLAGMDERAKIGAWMELTYMEYFHRRLGVYAPLPAVVDDIIGYEIQRKRELSKGFEEKHSAAAKYAESFKEDFREEYLRDCSGAMDAMLDRILAQPQKKQAPAVQRVTRGVARISSRLLTRTAMPKAAEALRRMFGTAKVTSGRGSLEIAYDPENLRHQAALELLESPRPNLMDDALAPTRPVPVGKDIDWAKRIEQTGIRKKE